jgi:hypothetical protein
MRVVVELSVRERDSLLPFSARKASHAPAVLIFVR